MRTFANLLSLCLAVAFGVAAVAAEPTSCYTGSGGSAPVMSSSVVPSLPAGPAGDPNVCVRYCFICSADDTACTSAQAASATVLAAYTVVSTSTAASMAAAPTFYINSFSCSTNNCNVPVASACATPATPAGSGATGDDEGERCYLETALYPGATTQCDNGVHTCASGYSCSKVTDGSCSNSNCPVCSLNPSGSTYWGCYSAAPTNNVFAALAVMVAVVAAMTV
jgi:hypothetical protein